MPYKRPLTFIVAVIFTVFNLLYCTACDSREAIEIKLNPTFISSTTTQIYIGGTVNNPGYYDIKDGDTLENLLNAAGGAFDNSQNPHIELIINQNDTEAQKIDINRADEWLLEALPGIGNIKAQAIVEYRTENGGFKNINELLKVGGIGQGIFDNLKNFITVSS